MKENKWRFGHVTHRSEQQRVGAVVEEHPFLRFGFMLVISDVLCSSDEQHYAAPRISQEVVST